MHAALPALYLSLDSLTPPGADTPPALGKSRYPSKDGQELSRLLFCSTLYPTKKGIPARRRAGGAETDAAPPAHLCQCAEALRLVSPLHALRQRQHERRQPAHVRRPLLDQLRQAAEAALWRAGAEGGAGAGEGGGQGVGRCVLE